MTMTRQQRRQAERAESRLAERIAIFRGSNPLAEETYRKGYNDAWRAACDFAMKSCYAAACLALHDLEGYSTVRNTRFLRLMDDYIVNALTSEEVMDDALHKAGVQINFREPFPEDRIEEVTE